MTEATDPTVLFLGYDRSQTGIIKKIEQKCTLTQTSDKVTDLSKYELVISYGYRHIISRSMLDGAQRAPVNLHISYLPFNRGAHPNFWSWVEGTPSGYSIHHIDSGIDTGDIIAQEKLLDADRTMTFSEVYKKLIVGIEELFIQKFDMILNGDYKTLKQPKRGTFHQSSELPDWMRDWDIKIEDAQRKFWLSQ